MESYLAEQNKDPIWPPEQDSNSYAIKAETGTPEHMSGSTVSGQDEQIDYLHEERNEVLAMDLSMQRSSSQAVQHHTHIHAASTAATPINAAPPLTVSAGPVYQELFRDLKTPAKVRSDTCEKGQELQVPGEGLQDVVLGSLDQVDFELVVQANVTPPCHSQQCNCGFCSRQGMVLIVNDWPCTIQGRFKADLPDGSEVEVLLEYVMIHLPSGDITDETECDVWVLGKLAVVNGAKLCIEVPARQLVSTYHGSVAAKKVIASSQAPLGTFHTYIRAGITCMGAQCTRSFRVYSSELYVCGARNLRRISKPGGMRHTH